MMERIWVEKLRRRDSRWSFSKSAVHVASQFFDGRREKDLPLPKGTDQLANGTIRVITGRSTCVLRTSGKPPVDQSDDQNERRKAFTIAAGITPIHSYSLTPWGMLCAPNPRGHDFFAKLRNKTRPFAQNPSIVPSKSDSRPRFPELQQVNLLAVTAPPPDQYSDDRPRHGDAHGLPSPVPPTPQYYVIRDTHAMM
ncbi:hypothetical protein ACRALDRAFT_213631 [Sodiomyces alcalophilus JCM 7366]|uniref:uncharacterized protein n=1 Tax=Sodiomyces alcalophilus JCM 7366 TaxID=591952 RepID=UPI0039B4B2D7